jgi:hypothetical protein
MVARDEEVVGYVELTRESGEGFEMTYGLEQCLLSMHD